MGQQELLEPLLGRLKYPGVGDLVLGGLQREPVEHGLWTVLGGVPHSWQDQLGETRQAHWTALRLGEQS